MCSEIKHTFQRVARDSPDATFLSFTVRPRLEGWTSGWGGGRCARGCCVPSRGRDSPDATSMSFTKTQPLIRHRCASFARTRGKARRSCKAYATQGLLQSTHAPSRFGHAACHCGTTSESLLDRETSGSRAVGLCGAWLTHSLPHTDRHMLTQQIWARSVPLWHESYSRTTSESLLGRGTSGSRDVGLLWRAVDAFLTTSLLHTAGGHPLCSWCGSFAT